MRGGGGHCLRDCRGRGLCEDERCLRGLTKPLKRQESTVQHERWTCFPKVFAFVKDHPRTPTLLHSMWFSIYK